ncbi:MAG: lytic transglycosylase domain-containing protein [bacterium]
MRHLTPYGFNRFVSLLAGLLLPALSQATPSLEYGPVAPVPANTLMPEAGPRLTERLSAPAPLLDPRFGETRWPCIIKGGQWAKRQSQTPLPAHAQGLIPELKKQFITEGLPQELAWVAEVESTLNTHAVSRSGARGLFQFKTEAARRFGLLKAEEDFRTTPDKSAKAAAQYLAQLYARFSDWTLSVAAYNAGEGCVGRLLKQHGARDYAAIAAELPPQTQVYVIKIMTTLALRENTQLSALPPPSSPPVSPTAN